MDYVVVTKAIELSMSLGRWKQKQMVSVPNHDWTRLFHSACLLSLSGFS